MKAKRRRLEWGILLLAGALGVWMSLRRPANFLLGSWVVEAHGRHYTVVFDRSGQATARAPEMAEPVKVRYQADFSSKPVTLDVWAEDDPNPYRMLCELTQGGELRIQETLPNRTRPAAVDETALTLRPSR